MIRSGILLWFREYDLYSEQVRIYHDLQGSALKLNKALGNCQTQSASLCVSGSITPDETFCDL